MDVLGTSDLTTAPTSRFATTATLQQTKSKDKEQAQFANNKALKPHKRILKFNKKHRQKQFTGETAFRKTHLAEKRPGLVDFTLDGQASGWN